MFNEKDINNLFIFLNRVETKGVEEAYAMVSIVEKAAAMKQKQTNDANSVKQEPVDGDQTD